MPSSDCGTRSTALVTCGIEKDAGATATRGAACCCDRIACNALGAPRIASLFDQPSDAAVLVRTCADAVAGTKANAAADAANAMRERLRIAMGPRFAKQSENRLRDHGYRDFYRDRVMRLGLLKIGDHAQMTLLDRKRRRGNRP